MKKVYLMAYIMIAISFTACGGGSDDTEEKDPVPTVEKRQIDIDVLCSNPPTINEYIKLQTDDKLIEDENNTVINIFHSENNTKVVCLEEGKAHIERK